MSEPLSSTHAMDLLVPHPHANGTWRGVFQTLAQQCCPYVVRDPSQTRGVNRRPKSWWYELSDSGARAHLLYGITQSYSYPRRLCLQVEPL